MRRFVQRLMAGAVLSVSIVAAAVGASYGKGANLNPSSPGASPANGSPLRGSFGETIGLEYRPQKQASHP